jgi:hypothetical protein
MSAVKLTKPQEQLLRAALSGAQHTDQNYPPTLKLLALDLVSMRVSKFGQARLLVTDAGRAWLEQKDAAQ